MIAFFFGESFFFYESMGAVMTPGVVVANLNPSRVYIVNRYTLINTTVIKEAVGFMVSEDFF